MSKIALSKEESALNRAQISAQEIAIPTAAATAYCKYRIQKC